MTATVAGIHLGLDTHANRPAANTCPDGSMYSCSTHGLIYKSNYAGNSWATWATLGSTLTARYTSATRTAGNLGLNATAITEVASGLRLTLAAAAGDVIEWGWSVLVEGNTHGSSALIFDPYTHDGSNARVNPFGAGLSASAASTFGVSAWYCDDTATRLRLGVPIHRTLVSGDIVSGNVTVGLWYAGANTNARDLFANTNQPLVVWMRNLGA